MAQHDIEHHGDNLKPEWWGAKQGLFINSLAGQYGQFAIDINWENTINQNTLWSYEVRTKGEFVMTNSISTFLPLQKGLMFISGSRNGAGVPQLKDSFVLMSESTANRNTFSTSRIITPNNNNIHLYTKLSFNGVQHYSLNPPDLNAFIPSPQRIKRLNITEGFGSSFFLSTDNLYPIGLKTMRVNYGNSNPNNPSIDIYTTTVVSDFRIYTRIITDQETSNNYHSFSATNHSNLFCEWKMSQLSDFYTYNNLLYAKNTGSSGNINQDGTGYDMQLIGYNSNIPILQSIY